jgi:hypothetical protein
MLVTILLPSLSGGGGGGGCGGGGGGGGRLCLSFRLQTPFNSRAQHWHTGTNLAVSAQQVTHTITTTTTRL